MSVFCSSVDSAFKVFAFVCVFSSTHTQMKLLIKNLC